MSNGNLLCKFNGEMWPRCIFNDNDDNNDDHDDDDDDDVVLR